MSEADSLVLRVDSGPLVELVLNRPDRRNALSRALVASLDQALVRISAESDKRVVLLSANGPVFCAGMDLTEASSHDSDAKASERSDQDLHALAELLERLHSLPQASIAVLHGDAYGGGAGLALSCDIVVMANSAKLGYPEVRRGLVGAIVLQDLIRQVGDRRARELLLTGEPLSAQAASAWGLVNRAVEPDELPEAVQTLARSILAGAPGAIAATKRLLGQAAEKTLDSRCAAAESARIRGEPEAAEGMAAFRERRPPCWVTSSSGSRGA